MKSKPIPSLPFHTFLALAILLFAVVPYTLSGTPRDQDQLEKSLHDAYKGKTLTLRNFYSGSTLEFDSHGAALRDPKVGPWTLWSRILVDDVKLSHKTLEIDAHRLFLRYLSQDKSFQALRAGRVRLRIDLDGEPSGIRDLDPILTQLFLKAGEDFSRLVPPYWTKFCSHVSDPDWSQQESSRITHDPKTAANGWTPPFPVYKPEPGYSHEAREAKITGALQLLAVIDQAGHVADVMIVRPIGMGLDENAVETVRTWRFKPAQHDGASAPVKIIIEMTFRL